MRKLLAVIFSLQTLFFVSQNSTILSSVAFTTISNADNDFVVKDAHGDIIILNDSNDPTNHPFCLYKFDKNTGNKLLEKPISFQFTGILKFITAFVVNDRLQIFVSVTDPKEKRVYLIKRTFETNNGFESDLPLNIDEFEIGFETDLLREYILIPSPDRTKLCIIREEISSSRQRIVNAKVITTQDNSLIWERKLNSNSENVVPVGRNFILDNEGRLYYLFETIDTHLHGIQRIGKNIDLKEHALLPAKKHTLIEPQLELINNSIICTGETLEGINSRKTNDQDVNMGFFLMEIDKETISPIWQTFDILDTALQKSLNYKDNNYFFKLEGIKSNHYSHKIYNHYKTIPIDKELYVIKYCGYKYEIEKINGEEIEYEYHNEILIFKYNKDHSLEWSQIIPRKIKNSKKLGLLFNVKNELCLYYFDNPSNETKWYNNDQFQKHYKHVNRSSILVECTVFRNGKTERKRISRLKDLYLYKQKEEDRTFDIQSPVITDFKSQKRHIYLIN